MSINSKRKGSFAERNVAELLSAWAGVKFERTPASGGLRWQESSRVAGDIVAPIDFNFPFSVEVKHYKKIGLPIKGELLTRRTIFLKFYGQCVEDAKRVGKRPLLFVRQNGLVKNYYFIAVDLGLAGLLEFSFGLSRFSETKPDCDYQFAIFESTDLFSVDYNSLIRCL